MKTERGIGSDPRDRSQQIFITSSQHRTHTERHAAREVLAQAEWRLAQKSVRAPVAGLVNDTNYVSGEWVGAGLPVLSLLPPQNIKLRFFVPEMSLGAIKVGQQVKVHCDGCSMPIGAQISFISPQAEFTPPVIYSRETRAKHYPRMA